MVARVLELFLKLQDVSQAEATRLVFGLVVDVHGSDADTCHSGRCCIYC